MKKTLTTTLLLATVLATPAFAQSVDQTVRTRAHVTHGRAAAQARLAGFSYYDPYAVVVAGQIVGRDPDPNIRLMLRRDNVLNED